MTMLLQHHYNLRIRYTDYKSGFSSQLLYFLAPVASPPSCQNGTTPNVSSFSGWNVYLLKPTDGSFTMGLCLSCKPLLRAHVTAGSPAPCSGGTWWREKKWKRGWRRKVVVMVRRNHAHEWSLIRPNLLHADAAPQTWAFYFFQIKGAICSLMHYIMQRIKDIHFCVCMSVWNHRIFAAAQSPLRV